MSFARKEYESNISAEKICTTYKWVLKDWGLLYDIHYSKNIKSQKFLLNGTNAVICQLELLLIEEEPEETEKTEEACLKIHLTDIPVLLSMVVTVSSIDKDMRKNILTMETFKSEDIPNPIELCLSTSFPQTNEYLTDGALILLVDFTVIKSVEISSFPEEMSQDNFGGNFRENLKAILDNGSFYDVAFIVEDKPLFAHKVILAAKSDVLKAMFMSMSEEDNNSEIIITEIETDVFAEFLNFVYVGKVNNLETIVHKIIVVADKYQVYDLKTQCENYMSTRLDTENAVEYLLIAYKLSCLELKKKALQLIQRDNHTLANETNYKLLADYPTLIREVFGK